MGALASALPAYLQSWVPGASDLLPTPALRLPVSLLLTQPIVVLFGILAILRVWLSRKTNRLYPLGQKLSLWAALALFLAMLTPNRQVSDGVWTLIPLWALAALELPRAFRLMDALRQKELWRPTPGAAEAFEDFWWEYGQ